MWISPSGCRISPSGCRISPSGCRISPSGCRIWVFFESLQAFLGLVCSDSKKSWKNAFKNAFKNAYKNLFLGEKKRYKNPVCNF
jgi:hypothetical protein